MEAIVEAERNVAHKLIEEFMLLANETVASFLEGRGMPSLYRIHEAPDVLKVEEFEEFITRLRLLAGGACVGRAAASFPASDRQTAGQAEERPVAFLMLRTMQKARYAERNLGHFGLAADSYTHFTSPIRRYPDLVVHRMLRELRHQGVDMERVEEFEADSDVARHLFRDGAAGRRSRAGAVQWKKVRFMADKVGDEFDGYITGVAAVRAIRSTRRALRRGAGSRLEHGRRLLPLPREEPLASRREHAKSVSTGRACAGCRSCASTWSGARLIWA